MAPTATTKNTACFLPVLARGFAGFAATMSCVTAVCCEAVECTAGGWPDASTVSEDAGAPGGASMEKVAGPPGGDEDSCIGVGPLGGDEERGGVDPSDGGCEGVNPSGGGCEGVDSSADPRADCQSRRSFDTGYPGHHIVACVVYLPSNRSREHEIESGEDEKDLSDFLILRHLWLWDVQRRLYVECSTCQ